MSKSSALRPLTPPARAFSIALNRRESKVHRCRRLALAAPRRPRRRALIVVRADVEPVDDRHAARELALRFDRDPMARPGEADRAVERDRHRGRIGEREADLAGLDAIGLAGAAVAIRIAKCALAVPSASIAAISSSLSTEAPRETCQPTISIGEPRAEDRARRLRIDPDVVFGRRRDVALAAGRAAHHHAAADLAPRAPDRARAPARCWSAARASPASGPVRRARGGGSRRPRARARGARFGAG